MWMKNGLHRRNLYAVPLTNILSYINVINSLEYQQQISSECKHPTDQKTSNTIFTNKIYGGK